MNLGRACHILANIENTEFSDKEKMEAIGRILEIGPIYCITKQMIMNALEWLYEAAKEGER